MIGAADNLATNKDDDAGLVQGRRYAAETLPVPT